MIENPAEFRRELEKLNLHWLTGMPVEADAFAVRRRGDRVLRVVPATVLCWWADGYLAMD